MQELQSSIAAELGVAFHFDVTSEIARRVAFLVEYARTARASTLVLGISGGVDSTVAQYAVAGTTSGLVVGTDHAAEAVTGFFTKYGDGGFDLTPPAGLTKRRVRAIATSLGAEPSLAQKVPTANLETLRPLRPDEAALGVNYEHIDDFLEGCPVPAAAARTIVETYRHTAHKRALPAVPAS